MDLIETKLMKLAYELPPPPAANGNYQPWALDEGLFVTSGQLSRDGSRVITGPIRDDADLPRAQEAARVALLRCLALFSEAQNSGARMQNVVSLRGFVACTPEFGGHSKVLDAASDLLVELFGDQGRHVRSALGIASLPANGLVELELSIRCC